MFVTLACGAVLSLPVCPIRGAVAGLWRAGRLEQVLPAERGLAALGVLAGDVLRPQHPSPECVVSQGHE